MKNKKIMYAETIRGYPYMPKKRIAEEFGISKSTVYVRMKEIDEEIKSGRYNEFAIIEDGNIVLINVLVFIDFLTYRSRLKEKNMRKYVPEFRPDKIIRMLGWNDRLVTIGEEENND